MEILCFSRIIVLWLYIYVCEVVLFWVWWLVDLFFYVILGFRFGSVGINKMCEGENIVYVICNYVMFIILYFSDGGFLLYVDIN